MRISAVPAVLKEGMIVNTNPYNRGVWYQNIIYKVQDNYVFLALVDRYLENALVPGSVFTIKHSNEYFEYLLEGKVSAVNPRYPALVAVEIDSIHEIINIRSFPRYDTYLPAEIESRWENAPVFSIVTNICLGGMAFLSANRFENGEELRITVYLPDKATVSGRGEIIAGFEKSAPSGYRLKFTEMDEYNNNLLYEYLQLLDNIKLELQDDFERNIKGRV